MYSSMENNSQDMTTHLFHENPVAVPQTDETEEPAVRPTRLCAHLTPNGSGITWAPPEGQNSDPLGCVYKEAPLTPHAKANAKKSTGNQASALDPLPKGTQCDASLASHGQTRPQEPTEEKDMVLDQILEELMEMPFWEQNMVCSSQSNPIAASQIAPDNDILNTFSGDQTLHGVPSMNSGDDQTPNGSQTPYTLAQIQQENQIAFTGSQITDGSQMTLSWDQSMNWNQAMYTDSKILRTQISFTVAQTGSGSQTCFNRDQKQSGSQMVFSGYQTQSGNQMPFIANQTLYGNQVPFRGDQTINENQSPFSMDQTHYEGQMAHITELQTVSYNDDEAMTGSQPLIRSNDQFFHGIQTVQQKSSLPQPENQNPNAHLDQGPSLESKKTNKCQRRIYKRNAHGQKCYECTFEGCKKVYHRASHLRIHERVHTGDRPYVCDVEGCMWKFPRSDELRRHKKTHTGERPYRCPQCQKDFARADHVNQHAKVHSYPAQEKTMPSSQHGAARSGGGSRI